MSEYRARVWLAGEPASAVDAVIAFYGGRVLMHTREKAIGDWNRREVTTVVVGDTLELTVEGEKLIVSPVDPELVTALTGQTDLAATIRELAKTAKPISAKHLAPHGRRWVVASSVVVGILVIANLGRSATIGPTTTTEPSTTAAVGGVVETTSTTAPITTTTEVGLVEVTAHLVSVTDGDTIRVLVPSGVEEPVRLIGIDAPEPGQRLAEESAIHLRMLLGSGPLRLVPDVSDRDRFDRLLRYLYVGEVFINEEMVRAGLAVASRYPPDTAMAAILEDAQIEARVAGIGGWATVTTSSSSTTTAVTTTTATATTTAAVNCHPSYEGTCLAVDQGDYDCAGGSGNGPNYVQGPVYVVGPDVFDLDGNDNDGVGCEN